MKTIASVVALLIWASIGQAQTLTASQAKAHEGENTTVCGKVASEKTAVSSRGEPTFINLDAVYPNQVFTILVWGDDRKSVGELPHVGSHICATGLIKDYRGVPEIVVRSSVQFSR
jgi:DNA/RNA endonuclease YhcR with UshA esterase domain